MPKFYCLVCGGRDYMDRTTAFATLDRVRAKYPDMHVVEGGAKGADRLGREWAIERGVEVTTFPADWDKYGKAAGYRRNEEMANFLGRQSLRGVVAFPGGRGTANMIALSERLGFGVLKVNLE